MLSGTQMERQKGNGMDAWVFYLGVIQGFQTLHTMTTYPKLLKNNPVWSA